jgi:hypothetical protein
MTNAALNAVLGQLDLGNDRKKAEKQQRLRVYIGLRANPAYDIALWWIGSGLMEGKGC